MGLFSLEQIESRKLFSGRLKRNARSADHLYCRFNRRLWILSTGRIPSEPFLLNHDKKSASIKSILKTSRDKVDPATKNDHFDYSKVVVKTVGIRISCSKMNWSQCGFFISKRFSDFETLPLNKKTSIVLSGEVNCHTLTETVNGARATGCSRQRVPPTESVSPNGAFVIETETQQARPRCGLKILTVVWGWDTSRSKSVVQSEQL